MNMPFQESASAAAAAAARMFIYGSTRLVV
jgi:hypothetical protein